MYVFPAYISPILSSHDLVSLLLHHTTQAFVFCLEGMAQLGIKQTSDLQDINEEELKSLRLLDGHKIALLHVKENGVFHS